MDKLNTAIDIYLSGDISSAKKLLKEHIDESGLNLALAYYHLGLCYADQNLLTDACGYLQKAVAMEEKKAVYHYRLGMVYSRLMILDKAIEELNITITLNPEHLRATYLLGTIYFKEGDMKSAIALFSKLIASSPDFPASYYHRALSHYHLGDNSLAKSDLYKAIELNPNYDEALIKLAEILANEDDHITAIQFINRVYKNGMRSYRFLYFCIMEHMAIKDYQQAGSILDEAKSLYPHNSELETIKISDNQL